MSDYSWLWIILVAGFFWFFVLPIVLFVRTHGLKRDYRTLKKECAELATCLARLQEAQKDSDPAPAVTKPESAVQGSTTCDIQGRQEKAEGEWTVPEGQTPLTPSTLPSSPALPVAPAFSLPTVARTQDTARVTLPEAETSLGEAQLAALEATVRAMYPEHPAGAAEKAPALETTSPETPVSESEASLEASAPSMTSAVSATRQTAKPASFGAQYPTADETAMRQTLPPSGPSWLERAYAAGKDWLLGGNTVLRVGVTLLFIGLAFLLRYASEQFVIPVETRYIGVALSALALLALGFWLRRKKPAYGLILQGAGVAVLYLTTFAALRLHPLLSSGEALTILVAVTLCSVILAVAQDALGLALTAVIGGFAAPILTSTGSGNHIALFGYFALLNTGVVLIAWFKAWRILNLAGFVCTFGIGVAWGLRSYTSELFLSTEPFLLLFFLMYVGIGLLFTRRRLLEAENAPSEGGRKTWLRWSAGRTDTLDGGMIFGPPLVGFGLQCALIAHIEFGMAFSALCLGGFYLVLALFLRGGARLGRVTLLYEICLALGVVFGTLAIPLALDAQWTSAAWAVEGAGIYWLGLRQSRRLSRAFALFLIFAASLAYLKDVEGGVYTLLSGSPLGAAMLGVSLLFCYRALRLAPQDWRSDQEVAYGLPILATAGLAFLSLIFPLCFDLTLTVMSWALFGLLTLLIGVKLGSRAFLHCALGVQLLGGGVLLFNLRSGMGGHVLDSGWRGLLCASLLGGTLMASAFLAQGNTWARAQPRLSRGLGFALLAGLVFFNLAALFVLDWARASVAWAVSGLLIFWLGYALRQRLAFYFGLFLEALSGLAFLLGMESVEEWTPLAHAQFWAPAALALAALACAWRLYRANRLASQTPEPSTYPFAALSGVSLCWGIGWWTWAAVSEAGRFQYSGAFNSMAPVTLMALSASALLWMCLARYEQWRGLALAALLPLATATLVMLQGEGSLLARLGFWAWPLFFATHLLILRHLSALLPKAVQTAAHVLGCWLLIGVLSFSMHDFMISLSEAKNAWRWLGWALVPSLYLFLASGRHRLIWPITEFGRAYRYNAALPVAIGLLSWFWLANLFSNGASAPLPYLPLMNPLEIGLLLVLTAIFRWYFAQRPEIEAFAPILGRGTQVTGGASLLALLTLSVCRAAHHWGATPFHLEALFSSMTVQAGWSLVWTCSALALMIGGNRRGNRAAWMTGAALVGVVVVKLFFVELGESGSLARIVSFIGVGFLLLIVGYFSPLPPRVAQTQPNPQKTS